MRLSVLISVFLFIFTVPALALDCANANSTIHKAICSDTHLLSGYAELDEVFSKVGSVSTPSERIMLTLFHKRRLDKLEEDCRPDERAKLKSCITEWLHFTMKTLQPKQATGPGSSSPLMPVFFQQLRSESAADIDYRLLRFVDPTHAGEKFFNSSVKGTKLDYFDENVSHAVDFDVSYASASLLSVKSTSTFIPEGEGHFAYGITNINIGTNLDRKIETSDVLSGHAAVKLTADCRNQIDLKMKNDDDGDFVDKDDTGYLDETISRHINDWSKWSIYADKAIVTFNTASISHSSPYECEFKMPRLKALAKTNAPLP